MKNIIEDSGVVFSPQPKPIKQDKNMKKLKKLGTKTLTNKLDQAIRNIFKTLPMFCFVCGRRTGAFGPTNKQGLQVGHYITRSIFSLRWDLKNLEWNCAPCNIIHRTNTIPFTIAMIRAYGVERIEYLNAKFEAYKKIGKTMNIGQKTELLEKLQILAQK